MFPVILLLHWLPTLHAMHHGWWATAVGPNLFAVTPAVPRPGPVMLWETIHSMHVAIRHGAECIASPRGSFRPYLCTPGQIPR